MMKKMLSALTTFVLCVSMCISSSTAFAEDEMPQEYVSQGYVEGEVLVVFNDEITSEDAQEAIEQELSKEETPVIADEGEISLEEYEEAEVQEIPAEISETTSDVIEEGAPILVELAEDMPVEEAVDALSESKDVEYVQPNFIYTLDEDASDTDQTQSLSSTSAPAAASGAKPNDQFYSEQWNMKYIDAKEAWDLIDRIKPEIKNRQKVKVAVVDTGVSRKQPDMQENVALDLCVRTVNGKIKYAEPVYRHGTEVASLIAATSNNKIGVAGAAAGNSNDIIILFGANVFHSSRRTSQASATTADTVAGLEYARENGARVINMSMGYNPSSVDVNRDKHDDAILKKEIEKLVYKDGITITCSGGNDGKGSSYKWYPGDFGATISVISAKHYKNAWGNIKNESSNYGKKKDLIAPGERMRACGLNGTYRYLGGTSAAATQVSSVAAMMYYVYPDITPKQVREIINKTATDVYKKGRDSYTGNGMVNAYTAVRGAVLLGIKAGKINITVNELKAIDKEVKPKVMPGQTLGKPLVSVKKIGKTDLQVRWTGKKPSYTYKIKIYRAKGSKSFSLVKTFKKSVSRWLDRDLKENTYYRYKMKVYGTSDGKKVVSKTSDSTKGKTGK